MKKQSKEQHKNYLKKNNSGLIPLILRNNQLRLGSQGRVDAPFPVARLPAYLKDAVGGDIFVHRLRFWARRYDF